MRTHAALGIAIGLALVGLGGCSDGATPLPAGSQAGSGGAASGAPGGGSAGAATPTGGASAGSTSGGAGSAGSGLGGTTSGGNGGASAGAGGNAGAGAGGTAGSAGSGGSGGASGDGWVKIFNGQDLTGWVPLIHKWDFNEDPYETFRADPVNHVIRVTYEDYPGQNFDDHCGLLYYDKHLTDYRVRVTYRFLEPQANNPVGWGKNNTGLMIFAIDPRTVMGDPEFPPLIEIQLLGTPSAGGTNNGNLCQPGGMWVSSLFGEPHGQGGGCVSSKSGTAPPASQWVTVEAEVHVDGETKVFQYPDTTNPVLTMAGPMYQGQPVTGGYLALQSESQPLEFKDVELMELP